MRRLNRNRVKTNQIGQYTLKINSIILKLLLLLLNKPKITIINLSASRQIRSSENRDALENRLDRLIKKPVCIEISI
jgi:hypothetical protein